MPTTVRYHPLFGKQLERLERKYRRTTDEVDGLLVQLERGRSGGFRVIYYAQIEDVATLLTIYSKFEETDISTAEIRQLVMEVVR